VFGSKEGRDGRKFKMFSVWFDGGIRDILMNRKCKIIFFIFKIFKITL